MRQLGAGLVLAAVLLSGLVIYVQRKGDEARPAREPVTAHDIPRQPVPSDVPPGGRQVLHGLRGTADSFHLAPDLAQLPSQAVPVLRIRPGGVLEIAVAPPLAATPDRPVWSAVGILVPRARIADLGPAERASLVAALSHLAPTRGLGPEQVRVHGCVFREAELPWLLRWLR